MILKAGTYRFNDVIDLYDTLDITFNFTYELSAEGMTAIFYCSRMYYDLNSQGLPTLYYTVPQIDMGDGIGEWGTDTLAYVDGTAGDYTDGWQQGEVGYPSKTVNIHTDVEVDDVGGNWFIASTDYNEVNTKPLAEITYNGETIAQLNAGETATLSCEGKKMASDVVVKVNEVESKIPDGYIKPEGSLSITENGTYPVTDKEEVVVDVPIPEGYVKPEGTLNILQNNTTYDVSQYAEVRIATAHPYEVPLEMLMNNVISDASQATIGNVYKYTGETTDTYENGALYILEEVSE